jgi:hypothetical protein
MTLGFSNLDQAFILGSSQIKDTQEEIANLKKLILETSTKKKVPESSTATNVPLNYTRIGPADPVVANFSNQTSKLGPQQNQTDTNDLMLLKVISHPKFDDIVKSYVLMNHPEWMNGNLTQTRYSPQSKSFFGNKYANTICSDIKRYIVFFIVCILIFVVLTLIGPGKP